MGDVEQAREPAKGLTFEDVWAMFQETDRKMQETDRIVKETAKQMQETDQKMQETAKQMRETDRKIGKLGNRFGEMTEYLVRPNILEKFRALGYAFTKVYSNVEFFDRAWRALTEVDIWLENGEFMMVVEIKSRLRRRDVEEQAGRMELLRADLDEREDRRKLLGATAAVVIPGDVRDYVLERGFYLIEPSGDTVKIAVPEGFTPKWW
jgi:hypothetical protein